MKTVTKRLRVLSYAAAFLTAFSANAGAPQDNAQPVRAIPLAERAEGIRRQLESAPAGLPALKYDPATPTIQPGDIWIRTGPIGTIPHGGNYWGPTKVGSLEFDSVHLNAERGQSYILPTHWRDDPGPGLNFYRPLEAEIPCRYGGQQTTLRNLPTEVKQQVINAARQYDVERLGTSHGEYRITVLEPSNHCIDSLLEAWGHGFEASRVVILDDEGRPCSFRDRFRTFQTANPMSWPDLGPGTPMGVQLPRVDPPRNQPGPSPSRSASSDSAPARSSGGEAGVSFQMSIGPRSFVPTPSPEWDRRAEEVRRKAGASESGPR